MRQIMLLALVLCLTGCCSTFCKQDPCVPLVTKPKPPPEAAFVRPNLSIEGITTADASPKIFEAYVMSIDELQSHILYLEGLLRGYK